MACFNCFWKILSLSGPFAVDGRIRWIRICLSDLLFCLDWLISFFLKRTVLEAHVVVCVTARFFGEKKFPKSRPKYGFLSLSENLDIVFFLNLVYKESLYYFLYSTNPVFGKYPVCRIRLQNFWIAYISRINRWKAWCFACWIKKWCGHPSSKTQKLAVSEKWINGTNWFLMCW